MSEVDARVDDEVDLNAEPEVPEVTPDESAESLVSLKESIEQPAELEESIEPVEEPLEEPLQDPIEVPEPLDETLLSLEPPGDLLEKPVELEETLETLDEPLKALDLLDTPSEPVVEPLEVLEPPIEPSELVDSPEKPVELIEEPSQSLDEPLHLLELLEIPLEPVAPLEPLEPVTQDKALEPFEAINKPGRTNSIESSRSAQRSFKSWFNIKMLSQNNSKEDLVEDVASQLLNNDENYDLILSRYKHNDPQYDQGSNTIKSTFNEIKLGIQYSGDDDLIHKIDWEFWSKVVNDYSSIVTKDSSMLLSKISEGIPTELRGMIWQIITNSKSQDLEQEFSILKNKESVHEKAIKRDLSRTRFMNNEQVKDKLNEVFNIIKAYSLYDPEIGYTQGMAFITVPLLINMSESESFCLLCSLMNNYNFRSLYLPEMPGLVLKLYQFDRVLEDLCPQLSSHLLRQGVRSSMYLTQWFLTLFGYKFPLEIVMRIFDIVMLEGLETILKFLANLMIQNKDKLLTLSFEELLKFLKEELFYFYRIGGGPSDEISAERYRLNDLVADSMQIKILPITLEKYKEEFLEIHRLEQERELEIESLRVKNAKLTRDIRKLENSYLLLNKEHVEIANEMILGKVRLATLEDENKSLVSQNEELKLKLSSLDQDQDQLLQKDLDLEIEKTMQRNLEVMETNRVLEEQLASLEQDFNGLSAQFSALTTDHKNLKSRLRSLMR